VCGPRYAVGPNVERSLANLQLDEAIRVTAEQLVGVCDNWFPSTVTHQSPAQGNRPSQGRINRKQSGVLRLPQPASDGQGSRFFSCTNARPMLRCPSARIPRARPIFVSCVAQSIPIS